jgi:hypothetical protein
MTQHQMDRGAPGPAPFLAGYSRRQRTHMPRCEATNATMIMAPTVSAIAIPT